MTIIDPLYGIRDGIVRRALLLREKTPATNSKLLKKKLIPPFVTGYRVFTVGYPRGRLCRGIYDIKHLVHKRFVSH